MYFVFISLLFGIITIIYEIYGYILNLTKTPLIFFLLYLFTGLSSIFVCPLFMNLYKGRENKLIYYLLLISLIISGAISLFIGLYSVYLHLISPS
ncbi:MAG: DUF981 family protein [Nanopusillaceae archaeon]